MSATTFEAAMTGNPVVNSARADLFRVRKWPAVWFTVAGWLVMNALFNYVFNYISYTSGEQVTSRQETNSAILLASLLPTGLPDNIVQTTPMFGGAVMMVLGAIIAGNGYGWGTWKTVLTQGPSGPAPWPGRSRRPRPSRQLWSSRWWSATSSCRSQWHSWSRSRPRCRA